MRVAGVRERVGDLIVVLETGDQVRRIECARVA
jgi:hypothetical protein